MTTLRDVLKHVFLNTHLAAGELSASLSSPEADLPLMITARHRLSLSLKTLDGAIDKIQKIEKEKTDAK